MGLGRTTILALSIRLAKGDGIEGNIHHAKTNLSSSSPPPSAWEEVVIARAGKPAVKLVEVTQPARKSRNHMIGAGIGKISMADDWHSPETNLEIQRLFETEDENVPIILRPKNSAYGHA